MAKNLIDGITATDATKKTFSLSPRDFQGAFPALKSSGLGSGDSIRIWEWVNGAWANTGVVLDSSTTSRLIEAPGTYAVDAVLATAGPVSCDLNSMNQ